MGQYWTLVLLISAAAAGRDVQLAQPLTASGSRLSLSDTVSIFQQATGRQLRVSSYVPEQQAFVASPKKPASEAMDGLAMALSTAQYGYRWTSQGRDESQSYLLSRVPTSERGRVAEAERRLSQQLDRSPHYAQKPLEKLRSNDAVPARFELMRQLSPAVRDRVIRTALSGNPVTLPASAFDRNTLVAATGGVVVRSKVGSGDFSWQDIGAGNGYVVIRRTQLSDGNYGLRLSIRSGKPDGRDISFSSGPSTDLIESADQQFQTGAPTRGATTPGGSYAVSRSKEGETTTGNSRVSIRRDATLGKDELPLSNVLRQLAAEAKTTVVAVWPDDFAGAKGG